MTEETKLQFRDGNIVIVKDTTSTWSRRSGGAVWERILYGYYIYICVCMCVCVCVCGVCVKERVRSGGWGRKSFFRSLSLPPLVHCMPQVKKSCQPTHPPKLIHSSTSYHSSAVCWADHHRTARHAPIEETSVSFWRTKLSTSKRTWFLEFYHSSGLSRSRNQLRFHLASAGDITHLLHDEQNIFDKIV